MPEYKRKKVRKAPRDKSRQVNKKQNNDIIMQPSYKGSSEGEVSMRVVTGRKLKNQRRLKVTLISAAVILAFIILFNFILPVSIAENITNTLAIMGTGSYPLDISGVETLNTVSKRSYYYVLSDTNIQAFTNGGKRIFNEAHGLYSPVLVTSDTRALIFDQGGNSVQIYNLGGLVKTVQTKKAIINASVSRSGTFALVTESDDYTAVVTVYSKNFDVIYEWNSAKDIVNCVAISPNGKKIAVSTLNASGGKYTSKVHVLGFDSADPLHTVDLQENIVLYLTDAGKGFNVVTHNSYRYVNWSKYTSTEISDSGEIDIFRQTPSGAVIVFNRVNDKSDNTVIAVSNKGKEVAHFNINGIISDIKFTRGHIYCISDTTVSLYDKEGNLLRSGNCGYGAVRFSAISEYALAIITDSEIQKTELVSKE